ncbi:hypothetical protein J6590_041909 [Homalodisca vitripennis]|nr:hypothetical protein J6590_041909 [Homalodisca vitripennis]
MSEALKIPDVRGGAARHGAPGVGEPLDTLSLGSLLTKSTSGFRSEPRRSAAINFQPTGTPLVVARIPGGLCHWLSLPPYCDVTTRLMHARYGREQSVDSSLDTATAASLAPTRYAQG